MATAKKKITKRASAKTVTNKEPHKTSVKKSVVQGKRVQTAEGWKRQKRSEQQQKKK